jgi:AcrR family transcriptional regulator
MHTLLLDTVVASWERDGGPVERLRTLVLGMLERIDDNPAFFRLTIATQGVSSQVASTVGAELDLIGLDIAGLIRDVIEQGTRSGDFRLLDADKAMTFVGQQLYGAMSVRAGDPRPAPLDEAADELCTFLLYGLAGPARVDVPTLSAG